MTEPDLSHRSPPGHPSSNAVGMDVGAPEASAALHVGLARKRPKPGERRTQILQALADMMQQPSADRITTAALAARLDVSEAALYRHFASKAQMFEGLIDFIEQSVLTLVGHILEREQGDGMGGAGNAANAVAAPPAPGVRQAFRIVVMLMQFAQRNPGMVRVMVGDALVLENERLQQRMNLFFDKIEATLRQCLLQAAAGSVSYAGSATPSAEAQVRAALLVAFCLGRMQRFVRSGFRRHPTEHLDASLGILLG